MNGSQYQLTNCLINFKNFGKFFYIINPYETTFEFPSQVPDYQQQAWIPFFFLIFIEQIILLIKKSTSVRLNDQVTSLSHWILQESGRIFFRGAEHYIYICIFDKYRIWSLPWNSLWTWYITAISVDFCYYWVHRANHEIHLLWSQHQVHHSSEEFNLVVGLRQSVLQQWCNFIFYLPLALFIPPSHYIAHHQFNLIYQFWIHTTVVNDLGPLEFVFNTPKHHRVHHGCNLYCLDKNYGGVLIIWDRIFGTFAKERLREEIVYGLVVSPKSFNPLYLQAFYTRLMIEKSLKMEKLSDKIAVLWKGPSWAPGLPRLGLDEYKINVTSRIKYDPHIPAWKKFYIILHFATLLYKLFNIHIEDQDCKSLIIDIVLPLTTIGLLFDCSNYADIVELIRCIIYIARNNNNVDLVFYINLVSCCLWVIYLILRIKDVPE